MYHIVMPEGLRGDLLAFLNPRPLAGHWPTLRSVVGHATRDAWQSAFPELNEGSASRFMKLNDLYSSAGHAVVAAC
jgi:hypothetical protein